MSKMTEEQSKKIKEIIKAEHRRLFAFIRSKISQLEESEDLLQDVYLQLLGNLNVLDSIDNLTGWLYTVAKNKIIDWYRRRKLKTISLDTPVENGIQFEDILAEELPDSMEASDRDIVYQAIIANIDLLPEKQKFVFIQQVINGRTFRELAEETGESLNTLIARKRYAVLFLQSQLKEIKQLINVM